MVSITGLKDINLRKLWKTVEDKEPGVLQSVESQRVGRDLATKQQQQSSFRGNQGTKTEISS